MIIDILTKRDLEGIHDKLNILLANLKEVDNGNSSYTVDQLSKKLHVSTKTVHTWKQLRLIEFIQVHNKILFTEKAVQDFLSNHTIKRKK